MGIRRCRLEKRTLSAFIFILQSDHAGYRESNLVKLEQPDGSSILRSSEICIIDYFFIAPN